MRYRETVPASGHRLRLARSYIPAGARAARSDRTADRKWREHDHLDRGDHGGILLGHLTVDLKDAAHGQEIFTGIGRMDLRDTQVDGVGVGRGRKLMSSKNPLGVSLGGND